MSKSIVLTGASGLIGSKLVEALRGRDDHVTVLTRGTGSSTWDPGSRRLEPELLAGADAVVNLNGVGIGDKRWSDDRKKLILKSRVDATSLLAETMASMENPPKAFVSASAIGFYGDTGDRLVDESSPAGDDFQAEVCVAWEEAAGSAAEAGVRVVHPRTGIVLSRDGGALKPMTPLFKMGVGGKLGDGSQWWSWIGIEDEIRALMFLIDTEISGPVNLVAPNPVRNAEFTEAFGTVLGRPAVIPVPKFALDIRLGRELAGALGYGSVRAAQVCLADAGFEFSAPTVDAALSQEFG
ncbi:MAG: TIGR01777 family oxidoreductase [Acidimicrobiia bacterium]